MAFSGNLITFGLFLSMAAIVFAGPGIGLDPEMTVDRMKALWQDNEELANAKACFRGIGPCSPLIENLKSLAPKVYKTACAACNDRERQVFRIGFKNSYEQDMPYFRSIVDKIDPEHTYAESFKNFMLADD